MRKIFYLLTLSIAIASCGVPKKKYNETVIKYQKELDTAREKNTELESENEEKSKQIKVAKKKVVKLKEEHKNELDQLTSTIPTGVYYRVQIGAIKNAKSNSELDQFLEKEGEYYKWRVGYFSTLEAAKNAKNDLKRLGVRKFWIVPMKNGETITFEKATLEEEISENGF